MPKLRVAAEAQIIDHWSLRQRREALLFFVAFSDRAWFNRNPYRAFRVRPAESIEIATLTQFERSKLRREAPLRERVSGKAVLPTMMIVPRAKEGQVPFRAIPVSPHHQVPENDYGAVRYILEHWCSEQDRAFILGEARIAKEREKRSDRRKLSFTKERETLRLPWFEPDASSEPGQPAA
jgi:hypothetical protein